MAQNLEMITPGAELDFVLHSTATEQNRFARGHIGRATTLDARLTAGSSVLGNPIDASLPVASNASGTARAPAPSP